MAVKTGRDFDTDEIVVRFKRGGEAGGFARFLEGAAAALENGHIQSTNKNPNAMIATPAGAANEIRKLAATIHRYNDA